MYVAKTDKGDNLCVVPPIDGIPKQYFLTANGDGTGTYNINGDYSGATATDLYLEIPTGAYYIATMLVSISASGQFTQGKYGTLDALSNGVKFFVNPGGFEIPLLSSTAVKSNYEWFELTPHLNLTQFDGLAQTMTIEFTMAEDYGMYFVLFPGMKFICRVQDNFTGLVAHTFGLRGRKI